MCGLKKQLKESQENQNNTDVKINNLLTNIQTLQEEKKFLEAKFIQKQTSYQEQVLIRICLYCVYIINKTNIYSFLAGRIPKEDRRMRSIM